MTFFGRKTIENNETIYFFISELEHKSSYFAYGCDNTKIKINFFEKEVSLRYGDNSESIFPSEKEFREWILENKKTIDPVIALIYAFYNITLNAINCWSYSRACYIALERSKSELRFILKENEHIKIINRFNKCFDAIMPS